MFTESVLYRTVLNLNKREIQIKLVRIQSWAQTTIVEWFFLYPVMQEMNETFKKEYENYNH